MTRSIVRWLARAFAAAIVGISAIGMGAGAAGADTTSVQPAVQTGQHAQGVKPMKAADGTPKGAVQWYKNHVGSTSWQGLCEKAAENAYGTSGVWPSAIAHWKGAPQHPGGKNPPKGAFVYWNISGDGHVGISDGSGGAYATSVNGAIGHIKDLNYYNNYLGWTPADVPSQ